jgi:predicted acylesterase/phospholipase RssA/CRP-like cAMP-binding protein
MGPIVGLHTQSHDQATAKLSEVEKHLSQTAKSKDHQPVHHVDLGPADLRQFQLLRPLTEATLTELCKLFQVTEVARGETICRQDEYGDSMYIVVEGRVKVTTGNASTEIVLRFLDRDEHFGEMSVLTGSRRTANVTAVTDARLLRIDRAAFDVLQQREVTFCKTLSSTLALRLASTVRKSSKSKTNRTIAVLCDSPRSRNVGFALRREMETVGASVYLTLPQQAGNEGRAISGSSSCGLPWKFPSSAELQRLCEQYDRVLIIDDYANATTNLQQLSQCDRILVLVESGAGRSASAMIQSLVGRCPALAPRVHQVLLLKPHERHASELCGRSLSLGQAFKIPLKSEGSSHNFLQGVRRVARFLLDQRVGLALGGGGARGLAHLGVLRAFEQEGIGIDLVAGTSMGALIGLSYAGGRTPQEAQTAFRKELTPGWLYRFIPRGTSWYMISKFRFRRWESMLRNYFGQATFEQLQIPLCTVSADLVRGNQIIRESGDAVHAILESINLPYISRPILRDDCVLVDGGVLNNVPVDLLRPRGANLAIGVDVCSQLPSGFRRRSVTPLGGRHKHPSFLETVFRLNEIRRHRVSSGSSSEADHMIHVDTSRFEFDNFGNANELAEVGYRAAKSCMPQIKQLVDERLAQSLKTGD